MSPIQKPPHDPNSAANKIFRHFETLKPFIWHQTTYFCLKTKCIKLPQFWHCLLFCVVLSYIRVAIKITPDQLLLRLLKISVETNDFLYFIQQILFYF